MNIKTELSKIDGILANFTMDEMMCEEDLQEVGKARGILHSLFVFTHSSLQLRKESKSFLNVKTIADLKRLYPEQSSYGIKCDKEYVHFSVNNKVVLTKALIV